MAPVRMNVCTTAHIALVVCFANNGTRKLVFARLALLLILAIAGYRCGSRLASQANPAFSFSPAIYEADH